MAKNRESSVLLVEARIVADHYHSEPPLVPVRLTVVKKSTQTFDAVCFHEQKAVSREGRAAAAARATSH